MQGEKEERWEKTSEREREKEKEKKFELRCFSLVCFRCQFNIVNEVSESKAMYNTSGSDVDVEEYECHSGSRKVRQILRQSF